MTVTPERRRYDQARKDVCEAQLAVQIPQEPLHEQRRHDSDVRTACAGIKVPWLAKYEIVWVPAIDFL